MWCPGNQLEARVTGRCSGRAEADCLARECREAGDWFRWGDHSGLGSDRSGSTLKRMIKPMSMSRLWLDVWQLRSGRLPCWADTIRLVYNRSHDMT